MGITDTQMKIAQITFKASSEKECPGTGLNAHLHSQKICCITHYTHSTKLTCPDMDIAYYVDGQECPDNGNGRTPKITPFCPDWNRPNLKFLPKSVRIGEQPFRVLSGVLALPSFGTDIHVCFPPSSPGPPDPPG